MIAPVPVLMRYSWDAFLSNIDCRSGAPINAILYTSDMEQKDRDEVIEDFNSRQKMSKVLVVSYGLASCGLNLQYACHICYHTDIPLNKAVRDQADGRLRRIGQQFDVISYGLGVVKTFNDRQWRTLVNKAAPVAITELNEQVFQISVLTDEFGDQSCNVGNFVLADNVLTEATSKLATTARRVKMLDADGVAEALITLGRGKRLEYK